MPCGNADGTLELARYECFRSDWIERLTRSNQEGRAWPTLICSTGTSDEDAIRLMQCQEALQTSGNLALFAKGRERFAHRRAAVELYQRISLGTARWLCFLGLFPGPWCFVAAVRDADLTRLAAGATLDLRW